MTDPTIAAWSRENDLLFQLRQLREENERLRTALEQPEQPVQRVWVGLTEDEIREIHIASAGKDVGFATGLTEAKLKEKNK